MELDVLGGRKKETKKRMWFQIVGYYPVISQEIDFECSVCRAAVAFFPPVIRILQVIG